jgi:hypothetical protein
MNVSNVQTTADNLLALLLRLAVAVGDMFAAMEVWLRGALEVSGVPHSLQTVILVAVPVLLGLAVMRVFDGLIRVFIVLLLLAIALHIIIPALQS